MNKLLIGWRGAVTGLMLLIAGALLFAGAVALLIVSYSNPALLFAGAAVCVFLGLARRSDVLQDLRLLIAGALMLAGAIAILIFSDFNPAPLFFGGGICAFLGVPNLLSGSGRGAAPVSADDLDNARELSRVQRHYYD